MLILCWREAGIPFPLFVNVSLLDKEEFITRKQLVEMSQSELCTIASHGVSHGEFALLNKEQALQDLGFQMQLGANYR